MLGQKAKTIFRRLKNLTVDQTKKKVLKKKSGVSAEHDPVRLKPNIHQPSKYKELTVVDTQRHDNRGARRERVRAGVCVCVCVCELVESLLRSRTGGSLPVSWLICHRNRETHTHTHGGESWMSTHCIRFLLKEPYYVFLSHALPRSLPCKVHGTVSSMS